MQAKNCLDFGRSNQWLLNKRCLSEIWTCLDFGIPLYLNFYRDLDDIAEEFISEKIAELFKILSREGSKIICSCGGPTTEESDNNNSIPCL